ncbi:hypothetical protein AYO45_05990 [Gammaproteobacteria bacterium SCGC AG-212-F23]|nr:hypothetical protein AYO45_05990 [Gammaproteobacteria bacterium SCGC AG-212-F23]
MKARWEALTEKEKIIVAASSIGAGILLCYALIFAPLNHAVSDLREKIPQDQKTFAFMQSSADHIESLKKLSEQHHGAATASLLGTVQKQLKNSLLEKQVTELQQVDSNTVHLTLQKTNFDELIIWLTTFWQEKGIIVSQISVTPNGAPGVVTADVMLSQ